jgi:ATP-dependent DNA helicase 2 subunit 2
MKIEDTYSPIIHRVNQAICQRAVYPDEEVKPPSEILTKWSNPPSKLVAKATSELQTLIDVADVKKGTFFSAVLKHFAKDLMANIHISPS